MKGRNRKKTTTFTRCLLIFIDDNQISRDQNTTITTYTLKKF